MLINNRCIFIQYAVAINDDDDDDDHYGSHL